MRTNRSLHNSTQTRPTKQTLFVQGVGKHKGGTCHYKHILCFSRLFHVRVEKNMSRSPLNTIAEETSPLLPQNQEPTEKTTANNQPPRPTLYTLSSFPNLSPQTSASSSTNSTHDIESLLTQVSLNKTKDRNNDSDSLQGPGFWFPEIIFGAFLLLGGIAVVGFLSVFFVWCVQVMAGWFGVGPY